MVIFKENIPKNFNEMATSCHPKKNGGRYPMWIRVEFTNGEYKPPHAHLYSPEMRPSPRSLLTKFLIIATLPQKDEDILVMKGWPSVPSVYAKLIVDWAKEKEDNVSNWAKLKIHWQGLEDSFL